MSAEIEVQLQRGWAPLSSIPTIDETAYIRLRGIAPDATCTIGGVRATREAAGTFALRPVDEDELRCHIGLLPITVDGVLVGEIEVVPGKMTSEAYERLVSDLQEVWTGLVLDAGAPAAVRSEGTNAVALWARLAPAVDSLVNDPVERLERVTRPRRIHQIRRAALIDARAHRQLLLDRPILATVVESRVSNTDLDIVRDCLDRLRILARRQTQAAHVVSAIDHVTSHPLLAGRSAIPPATTHACRFDRRMRVVDQVRHMLRDANVVVTIGPGELRQGIKALDRLYEYWVFLSIVRWITSSSGAPVTGIESLAQVRPGPRLLLDLVAGTEITWSDGTVAVFEPRVSSNPSLSWRGLELSPHPLREVAYLATPDVLVVRPDRRMIVIDAKYRARLNIDRSLAEVHDKYSRFRLDGTGVVGRVTVAHPNPGFELWWAGQAALPFVPGLPIPGLWHRRD